MIKQQPAETHPGGLLSVDEFLPNWQEYTLCWQDFAGFFFNQWKSIKKIKKKTLLYYQKSKYTYKKISAKACLAIGHKGNMPLMNQIIGTYTPWKSVLDEILNSMFLPLMKKLS